MAREQYAREAGQGHVDTAGGNELSTATEEGSRKMKTRTYFHTTQLYHISSEFCGFFLRNSSTDSLEKPAVNQAGPGFDDRFLTSCLVSLLATVFRFSFLPPPPYS